MARVLWTKGVDLEIVLSNPGSIPGNLSPAEANYGNGWSCVDVAAEIIKCIQKQFPGCEDDKLRKIVRENLRVCFLKSPRGGTRYKDGGNLGLHGTYRKIIESGISSMVPSNEVFSHASMSSAYPTSLKIP